MTIRIREARERALLSQKELARRLGINAATLSGYETGSHDPKPEALVRIADACGVTVGFLLGREEPPAQPPVSDEAMDLARLYDQLDTFGQTAVAALADAERRRVRAQQRRLAAAETRAQDASAAPWPAAAPRRTPDRGGTVRLRLYDSPAAAGSPNPAGSSFIETEFPSAEVPGGTQFAVRISGDSMEPDIPDGSVVFLGRPDSLADGDIVVAWVDEGAVCKRVCLHGQRVTRLMSLNRAAADYTGDQLNGLRIFGRVLGVRRSDAPVRATGPMRMTDRERGGALRASRIAAGLNLSDLAAEAGVSEQALRRWEDGAEAIPGKAMIRLCALLSLDGERFA